MQSKRSRRRRKTSAAAKTACLTRTPPQQFRVIIRGFLGKTVVFEEHLERTMNQLDDLLPELGEKHAKSMAAGKLHMIELEFPDMPLEDRFFRFGTHPAGMVIPIRFEI